ncbi:Trafficking protein particle complex subunit 33 [Scheffersomyces spartinae]|uniref:Trafficking protein particle complex subunit 33 n=1 Tax=Scheffersomyces spartinae TaxID=45513 RepID=A0A9P7V9E9_9ASCO|nr:Trafficking protein particle complex subunit 33 [Scheffersomyces spartinae]KAG7193654.1 Trafficking protein particle complex subunit 33 [Scheffersomyces spartinae]
MSGDLLGDKKLVNAACLDLFLQELVPTSIRVSQNLNDSATSSQSSTSKEESVEPTLIDLQLSTIKGDLPGGVEVFESSLIFSDDVTVRIETYGFNLGMRLAELLMFHGAQSNTYNKFVDVLEILKFVCRDVWWSLYGKEMDNLRTNHRGTFVLVDSNYKLISRINSAKGFSDTLTKSKIYLWFPCGVIRGIVLSFGIDCDVSAEITKFPAVTFNIKTTINN